MNCTNPEHSQLQKEKKRIVKGATLTFIVGIASLYVKSRLDIIYTISNGFPYSANEYLFPFASEILIIMGLVNLVLSIFGFYLYFRFPKIQFSDYETLKEEGGY